LGFLLLSACGCGKQPELSISASAGKKKPEKNRAAADQSTRQNGPMRKLAVAAIETTVAGAPAPDEALARWKADLATLAAEKDSPFIVVETRARADWIVQIAAPERTDLIYLSPAASTADADADDDRAMRMSPIERSAATAWLRTELAAVAHATNLCRLVQRCADGVDERMKIEVELRRLADRNDRVGEPMESTTDLVLYDSEMIGLSVRNPNPFPVRITTMLVDARGDVQVVFPRDHAANRLGAAGDDDSMMPVRVAMKADATGMERYIVLATKDADKPESAASDLRFMAEPKGIDKMPNASPIQRRIADVLAGRLAPLQLAGEVAVGVARWRAGGRSALVEAENDPERAVFGLFRKGPAENLKAEIVEEQSGAYHTTNRTQAILGSYGKMVKGNKLLGRLARYEHRGLIERVGQARHFATVQRRGAGTKSDFLSFLGSRQAWQVAELVAGFDGSREETMEFELAGLRLDQNDVIRLINADRQALDYFGYLNEKSETPCVVLENVLLLEYAKSSQSQLEIEGRAKNAFTPDGFAGQGESRRNSFTRFTAPVIRCYQTYEAILHNGRVMELANIRP
jgi:hypothetical protein